MPAIDLMRLRQQVTRLSEFFFLPPEFVRHLHELLNLYTNPTLRLTQASTPFSLFTYRTSPIILHTIQQEVRALAASYPEYALELADRLWKEEVLEMRLLAAFLLGVIPPHPQALLARLMAWINQARDPQLRLTLLDTSLTRLRREAPDEFLSLIAEWLHHERPRLWENGLQALIPLIREEGFENFPLVFRLLRPVLENAPPALQRETTEVIHRLMQRVPQETLFTFQRWLEESPNSHLSRALRRALPSLPPSLQQPLRTLLIRSAASQRPTTNN